MSSISSTPSMPSTPTVQNGPAPTFTIPVEDLDRFSMPAPMGIHEYAASVVRFSPQYSRYTNYRPELTPYHAGVLDAFVDPAVAEITLKWATQLGKSTLIEICLGYSATQDPGPSMMVVPGEKSRDDLVDRLTANFLATPEIVDQLPNGKASITREGISFRRMPLFLSLADSEADLAQRSVKRLFADEINKFPPKTTREGSPLHQAASRLRWYRGDGDKSVFSSSCTDKFGPISVRYDLSDQRQFHVRCLRCGEAYPWIWEQVRTDERPRDISHLDWGRRILRADSDLPVWYVCPICKGRMVNEQVDQRAMNAAGHWIAAATFSGHAGFHMPSMGSPLPSCTWRALLGEWNIALHEKEKGDDSRIATFIRHELARDYQTKHIHIVEANIVARMNSIPRGVVPEWVTFISLGTDIQHDCFYYVLQGWNREGRCHFIDHGQVPGDFRQVEGLIETPWSRQASVNSARLNIGLLDSGDGTMTMDVYKFCREKGTKKLLPCKGSSTALSTFFRWGEAQKDKNAQPLIIIDTNKVKDMLAGCLDRPQDSPIAVSFHNEIDQDPDFQRQMVSEERQRKKDKSAWAPRPGYSANHYWDAAVYAATGPIVANLFLRKPSKPRPRYSVPSPHDPYGRKL